MPAFRQFYFKHIQHHVRIVYNNHPVLYPSAKKYPNMWVGLINKYLKPYANKHNFSIKSHFFRINLITQLLRKTS
jgi:hypothetical protein